MRKRTILMAGATTSAIAIAVWAGTAAATSSSHAAGAASQSLVANCAAAQPAGYARCMSVHKDLTAAHPGKGKPRQAPSGYGPSDLQSAYNLGSGGSAQTVAVVDAYDDGNAESDLATYRSQYGLPACTTANGCFSKIDQRGGSAYPKGDAGWAGEISLDLDMVSAICPDCHILLVEADSNSFANLGAAEDTAAARASIVSNSWGGGDAPDSTYGRYFNHPGVAITASAGDSGYQGASYPASSAYVIAVGGTTLTRSSAQRGWAETAWSGTGSGCSSYNTAIPGAASFGTGCTRRAMNDVAAVADPSTGVSVYDTFRTSGGWHVYGGTSVSAPIIAATIGLAGNAASVTPSTPYGHAGALWDVTQGSNGSCSPTQWCTARAGWDGPTGLGTPNGTGAF